MNRQPATNASPTVRFPDDCPLTRLLLERIIEGSALRADDPGHARLFARAEADGFLPILHQYFRATGREIPRQSTKQWRVHIARLALYRAELRRVLAIVEALSPVVVLKGGALAKLLFGDERLRNTTDMDLLVDPRQIEAIIGALGAAGYVAVGSAEAKTWAYNQLLLAHEKVGTLLELHWRIAFPHLKSPAIADLFEETTPVALDGKSLVTRSLRPELLLLQLGYHFHQHQGFFKGLIDIAGWLDRFEDTADLDEIRALANLYGVDGVLQWGLHALAGFIGVRSRLYNPRANLFAKSWAAWTCAELERRYILDAPPRALERWSRRPTTRTKIAGVLIEGLSMSVADGPTNRLRAVVGPLIFGPHRLGRQVYSVLEGLGITDRQALFEHRILG